MTSLELKQEEFAAVGVARRLELPAFRYRQGGRTQYSTVISVLEVPAFVARKPDPFPVPELLRQREDHINFR